MIDYKELVSNLNNKNIIKVEEKAPTRFYLYIQPKDGDEEFLIEINFCKSLGNGSLPDLWFKKGMISTKLDYYMIIHTYCTDKDNDCYGYYNPQVKKQSKLNFDYVLSTNQSNLNKLIDKAIEMYQKDIKFLG